MNILSFIIRLLLFTFCFSSFAQSNDYYTAAQSKAFYSMLELDFSMAKKSSIKPTALDFHLKSLAHCMESFFYCDKQKYLKGKSLELKWLDSLSKTPECAEKRFAKAQIKLHWAFMSFAYDDKITAAFSMRQAFLILKENNKLYPEHKPTQLYFGLINTFLAEIPDNFQWIASLVGLKGNAELGQQMIESVKGYHDVLDFERQVWLLVKRPQYEEQEDFLLQICDNLVTDYGDRSSTKAIAAFYYLKNKKLEKAKELLDGENFENVTMFHYINGLIAYHSLDYEKAINSFTLFNKGNKSENFKKDVQLRLAHVKYLQGDSLSALKMLKSIKHKGNTAFYADKHADEISTDLLPNKLLLQSRIHFDAGNWEKSKSELLKWKVKSKIEKTEYFYRMARIEQQLKNLDHSKRCYKSCIGFCPKEKVYFGPFACLYLAEIYLKESNKILALHYVNTGHDFKNFDFKQSYISKNRELEKRVK